MAIKALYGFLDIRDEHWELVCAFVDALTARAVEAVRADMAEPSKVVAPPFSALEVHYLTEDLRGGCGAVVPIGSKVSFSAQWAFVTCRACREAYGE